VKETQPGNHLVGFSFKVPETKGEAVPALLRLKLFPKAQDFYSYDPAYRSHSSKCLMLAPTRRPFAVVAT
jgi:hypothetical protein